MIARKAGTQSPIEDQPVQPPKSWIRRKTMEHISHITPKRSAQLMLNPTQCHDQYW